MIDPLVQAVNCQLKKQRRVGELTWLLLGRGWAPGALLWTQCLPGLVCRAEGAAVPNAALCLGISGYG